MYFRNLLFVSVFGLLPSLASAETLVAVRPGVMCESASALAQLTLPDGSSRSALQHPTAAALAMKEQGHCWNIGADAEVQLQKQRKNTSIISVSGGTYVVPNIDFEPVQPRKDCLAYDPATVTLSGKIEHEPSYTDDDTRDGGYSALVLDHQICTISDSFDDAESGRRVLQLVFLNGWPKASPPYDMPVTITGKLYHRDNGNQETTVLIEVERIQTK